MAKFCIQCGATLNESARFCGDCGAAVPVAGTSAATPPIVSDRVSASAALADESESRKPNWLLIGGGAGLLALLLAYYLIFLRDDASSGLEDRVTGKSEVIEEVAAKSYYATADANIRDKATTQGTSILGKAPRGTSVSGKAMLGDDGTSDWLELADGKGFIAMVNLSETQPPEIVKPLGDKNWTTDKPIEIWAQPDAASTLIDRVAAGSTLTLFGLTANDYIEVKLKKGGVGYIADGARIAALANGKPIALAFNANSCSFGPEIDALFSKMGDRIRANYKALENKEYPNEEARAKALVAVEGRSTYEKLPRNYEGLTVTAIAQHYESQSVYFAEPAAKVIELFRSKGFKVARDGSIPSADLYAGIGSTTGEGSRYGRTDLSCGV
ncbi:MAG: hypothetical protein IPG54_09820 [Sphingomonadales bacterium]|jgi:uncharacterized protein YgiM (DUF1202 family)|nr:hypothetical protein [Sphingomonadales bacterium]MBK9004006.1 hypothetical protein [Sphingomonadales bacterium]MBK9269181.1 hypothetical protein [Sphingomonadales bacterium]MBP6434169.1 hypothetical protein [Sphingorhabdus sp.]